jgi:hypothetical protein
MSLKQSAEQALSAIKVRAWICVGLLHLGLLVAAASLALAVHDGGQASPWTLGGLGAGILVMYGAFAASVLSVWLPVRPWLRRYQRAREWREWILHELPTLLALIPVLVSAINILKAAWSEVREKQRAGESGLDHIGQVARKVAEQAEELSRDPGVELARKKIREAGKG